MVVLIIQKLFQLATTLSTPLVSQIFLLNCCNLLLLNTVCLLLSDGIQPGQNFLAQPFDLLIIRKKP